MCVNEAGIKHELYGREDAVHVVDELLAGGGSVVAVGAPGAGKTSLMKVAGRLARRQGRRVLAITPTQFERGLPFAGLAELIGQCPEGIDRHLPQPQRHALAVALQHAEPDGPEVSALAVPLAVRGVLDHLCRSEPVALLIDDLQWLDQSSVGSLGFAVRGVSTGPDRLSVLVATRPDPDTGTDLLRSLTEPRRDLVLRPLDERAVGQLLRSRLGPRWTPPRCAGVARASAGNPFLALEIAKAMHADGPHRGGITWRGNDPVFPVPPTLAGLLGERVTRLPDDARDVLTLVSAAGRLTLAQLQAIVAPDRLASALEAAADADVATVGAESAVAFAHPLLASALYDAAAPADRRRAHRLLADSLDDPVERARHRTKSITVPDDRVAGELERAADISRARGARQLAGELLEGSALATPYGDDGQAAFGRWLRAADNYVDAGDEEAARTALDRATALAVLPERQAQVLVRRSQLADDIPSGRLFAEQAFRLSPPDGELRAEILYRLGRHHRMEGRGGLALRLTQMALVQAAAHGRQDIQLAALTQRQAIERLWGTGVPGRSLDEFRELATGAGRDRPPEGWEWAWMHAFFAPWHDPAAEGHTRDAIASAVDAGRYADLSYLYMCLVLVLVRRSKFRQARAALREADHSGAWTSSTGALQEDLARILVTAYEGNLDEARSRARRAAARPLVSSSTYWRGIVLALLGFIDASARDWPAALGALREVAGILTTTGMVALEQLLWAVDYCDAALQTGSHDDARAAIGILRRQAAAGQPEAAVAADRCQALLTAAAGDTEKALAQLRAIVQLPDAESPFEAARSRLALGQVYRRAGHKALATETLNEAARAFDERGAPRWSQRALAEAERTGLRPATGTLTASEHRVAQLVGEGRSNQETADLLFMSVKTVEANLTRIYRKLSVRSRTELANRLGTLRSTPDSGGELV